MTAKPEMPDELYVRRSHTDGKHFSAVMTDSPLIAGRTKYRRADSPSPATEIDILDVIEWADGVKAALNSELASRVAREEAEIAYAINQAVSKQALSAPVAHKKGWGKIPHPSDDIYEDVKSGVSVALVDVEKLREGALQAAADIHGGFLNASKTLTVRAALNYVFDHLTPKTQSEE